MNKTVKILSLDGGGIRGFFSATFLKRFCVDCGINPEKMFNYFDIISGTSIGGIQALAYSFGKTPANMLDFFSTKGPSIFYYDSILPLSAYKFNVIMGAPTYPSTFYGQLNLRAALETVFGTTLKLSDLPGKIIIPSFNSTEDDSYVFSNVVGQEPFLKGANTSVVDVGLCTSAAPLYFPPVNINSEVFIDGGVTQNNPAYTAFSIAKKLYPSANRFCILSVGTGVANEAFVPVPASNSIVPYNVEYLMYLMDSVFISGVQELNDDLLHFAANDVFNDIFVYRFQHYFETGQDSSLDNYDPSNLEALYSYANAKYDADLDKINNFIDHFNLT